MFLFIFPLPWKPSCIESLGAIHSTKIPTGPTEKRGPPQRVDPFFRNFSGWTEPIHWVLDRNFRKFWLNGSRPLFSFRFLYFFFSNVPFFLHYDKNKAWLMKFLTPFFQQINTSRKRARTLHAPTILKSRFSRAFCAHSDANNWSDWFIPTLIEG